MKRILIILFCLLSLTTAESVSAQKPVKVEKEKHVKQGMKITGGASMWTFDLAKAKEYTHCNMGPAFGVYYFLNGLLTPSNPESRWAYDFGFGFELSSVDVSYNRDYKINNRPTVEQKEFNAMAFEILPIYYGMSYLLNPLSTHGKWDVTLDFRVCFLDVMPRANVDFVHLEDITTSFGMNFGFNLSFNYNVCKWRIGAGGTWSLHAPYSSTAPGTGATKRLGAFAQVGYLF